jgi:uncharacterized protein (TIGR00369 family)
MKEAGIPSVETEASGTPFTGFAVHLGMKIVDWPDGEPHLALDIQPHFSNRNGYVHGGILLSLLDTACSLAGCRYVDGRIIGRVVAVSLTTNFIAPVAGGTIHARARLRGGGTRLFIVDGEVTLDDGQLVATATGVGRRIRDEQV